MSTQLSRTSVSAIYSEIINKLGKELREDFLENDVGEEVLSEFIQIWQKKLSETKVALVDEGDILHATRSVSFLQTPQSCSPFQTTLNANQFHNRVSAQVNINRFSINPKVQTNSLPLEYKNSGYRIKSYGEYGKPLTREQMQKLNLMKNSGFNIENVLKDLQVTTSPIGFQKLNQPLHPSQFQGQLRALSNKELQGLRQNALLYAKTLPPGLEKKLVRSSLSCSSQLDLNASQDQTPTTSTTSKNTNKGKKFVDITKILQIDGVNNVAEDSETDDEDFETVSDNPEEVKTIKTDDNNLLTDVDDFSNEEVCDINLDAFVECIAKEEDDIDNEFEEIENLMYTNENTDDEIRNCEADINSSDDDDELVRNNFTEELSNNTFKNTIYCTFEKIVNSRDKWILKFTNGIINVGGKDYVFGKLNGSAKFN